MPTIDEIQAANQHEFEKLIKRHHGDRIEIERQAKVIVEQAEVIRGQREGMREVIKQMREIID